MYPNLLHFTVPSIPTWVFPLLFIKTGYLAGAAFQSSPFAISGKSEVAPGSFSDDIADPPLNKVSKSLPQNIPPALSNPETEPPSSLIYGLGPLFFSRSSPFF